jgi:3-mercaptopropionate dioxygenase
MLTTPVRTSRPELVPLIAGIRAAVGRGDGWQETATAVGDELRRNLPTADALTAAERLGDPDRYMSHLLHAEPDGSFSIVGLVWRPGQVTPVHDHVTWCVFGVVQGVEYEELYAVETGEEYAGAEDGGGEYLVKIGDNANQTGEVSFFAPPGDIHRVRNAGDRTAISIHVYGTDISRIGSSVRRVYDLPVR